MGAGWLAKVILIDAVISPAGTGIVYLGTTARLSYALGEEKEMPAILARTSPKGVPVVSILLATVIGLIGFGPFPTWSAMVSAVTGATAVMYAMGPVALGALKRNDPDRQRPYSTPMPRVVLPAAFVSANLILYFGGFDTMWKMMPRSSWDCPLRLRGNPSRQLRLPTDGQTRTLGTGLARRHALISLLGRYGDSQLNLLPEWVDLLVVIAFSIAVYYWALRIALPREDVQRQLAQDAHELIEI